MNRRQIDRFFKIMDDEFQREAEIILTGAAAGAIWGGTRPSIDIDFAVDLKSPGEPGWRRLETAVRKAVDETGVQANYAEDIDRWGMITLLDYRNHTRRYRKFGKLTVRVLNPAYWSIGKMTRFLDPDLKDMIQVFRKKKVSPARLAEVWGRAFRASPRSTALPRFRRQVESFFESFGTRIWGRSFDSTSAVERFHRSAGIGK